MTRAWRGAIKSTGLDSDAPNRTPRPPGDARRPLPSDNDKPAKATAFVYAPAGALVGSVSCRRASMDRVHSTVRARVTPVRVSADKSVTGDARTGLWRAWRPGTAVGACKVARTHGPGGTFHSSPDPIVLAAANGRCELRVPASGRIGHSRGTGAFMWAGVLRWLSRSARRGPLVNTRRNNQYRLVFW